MTYLLMGSLYIYIYIYVVSFGRYVAMYGFQVSHILCLHLSCDAEAFPAHPGWRSPHRRKGCSKHGTRTASLVQFGCTCSSACWLKNKTSSQKSWPGCPVPGGPQTWPSSLSCSRRWLQLPAGARRTLFRRKPSHQLSVRPASESQI